MSKHEAMPLEGAVLEALLAPLPLACMLYVYRNLPIAEATRLERARAAGEPV